MQYCKTGADHRWKDKLSKCRGVFTQNRDNSFLENCMCCSLQGLSVSCYGD